MKKDTRVLLFSEDAELRFDIENLMIDGIYSKYQCAYVASVNEFYSRLKQDEIDVVLVDDQKIDAVESHAKLSSLKNICSVVLSRSNAELANSSAKKINACDYILVPIPNLEILERAIRYSLNSIAVEKRISSLAHFDALTLLPNRALFFDRLQQAIHRADRNQGRFSLLYVDIDGFKHVNDNFGQDSGDQLICQVAERLRTAVRKSDSISRIGGDEFVILLEDFESSDDTISSARKIIEFLAYEYQLNANQVILGVSIGIATYPESGESVNQLLRSADIALRDAKNTKGSSYRFYSDEINAVAMNQLFQEAELRRAIRNEELMVYYQPRVDLTTGKVSGVEALVRWQHPKRGLIGPDNFIPLAESTGLIVPLGYWVMHQVCQDIERMNHLVQADLCWAINISFHQFKDERLVENIQRIFAANNTDVKQIELELTETAVMQHVEETEKAISSLHKIGFGFSLDDFGTGYSSFTLIQKRLPISKLKIDRSFVEKVSERVDAGIIVKTMIGMAHSLGLEVIAEGAETKEQIDFIRENGGNSVQGFHYSPPVPFNLLPEMINQGFQTCGPRVFSDAR